MRPVACHLGPYAYPATASLALLSIDHATVRAELAWREKDFQFVDPLDHFGFRDSHGDHLTFVESRIHSTIILQFAKEGA